MQKKVFLSVKAHYKILGKQFEVAAREAIEAGALPKNLWQTLGRENLFQHSVLYDNEDGIAYLSAALEGLAYGMRDPAPCGSLITQAGVVLPVLSRHASEAFKQKYWTKLLAGECVVAQAGTELHGGSEARLIETTAKPVVDGYQITGTKWSITNAPEANLLMVTTREENTNKPILLAVDTTWPGVDISHKLCGAGVENSPTGKIILNAVHVPAQYILGKVGDGIKILNTIFMRERLILGFVYAGILERVIEEVLAYADTRVVFGKRIIEYQYMRKRLTDMKCCYEITRLLAEHALALFMSATECSMEASISKFCGANLVAKATTNAMKILASYGIQKGVFDHILLSSIASSIGGGTEEMQREEIFQTMYLAHRRNKKIGPTK